MVAKVPRWDLKKFSRVSNELGSSMKSVGEVMAIGRNFEEVIQKACRMIDPSLSGFNSSALEANPMDYTGDEELDDQLKNPTFLRLFAVSRALEKGYSVDKLHDLTRIDKWFLSKLESITKVRQSLKASGRSPADLVAAEWRTLKCSGFSDQTIALCMGVEEKEVRENRIALGVTPSVKQIDTLAAEFPAQTNYLYITYNGSCHDLKFEDQGVMVLGCGPYCIGSSVEFDWCAVSCVRRLQKSKIPSIVINYNPETVSTDYDESDRLYFEELSLERTLDIYQVEGVPRCDCECRRADPQHTGLAVERARSHHLGHVPRVHRLC